MTKHLLHFFSMRKICICNTHLWLFFVYAETLQKYPPVIIHIRKSTTNYTFYNTKVNISKGQEVWIPIYAIQQDPNIYPEPDVFDPERFNEENTQARHAAFYLPFGDGPKSCIGKWKRIFLNIFFTIKNFIHIILN